MNFIIMDNEKRRKEEEKKKAPRKREEDERKEATRKRKSGMNYGRDKRHLDNLGIFPLSNKKMKYADRNGELEKAKAEQEKRKNMRKDFGEKAETHWEQYLEVVKANGLNDRSSLDLRINLLMQSVKKDPQALYLSHLFKTLVFNGDFELAKHNGKKWGKGVQLDAQKFRWKKASLCLQLYEAKKKNMKAKLKKDQWNSGRKFGLKGEKLKEVEQIVTEALENDDFLYLFDEADEEKAKQDPAPEPWTNTGTQIQAHRPYSQSATGSWD